MDLLGVRDDIVPGCRRLVRIEPRTLEDVGVPDERHRLVVGRNAVGHPVPGHGLHGAGPEILGRPADILGLERLQIALGGELGATQDLQADRHRRGIAEQRGAELVEQVVIGEGLFLELDVRIGLAEGLEEILVVLAQQVGVALEHALIPERQAPLVVERGDLAAIVRRVELLCARNGAHIFRRPLAEIDRRRAERRGRTSAMPSRAVDDSAAQDGTAEFQSSSLGILQILPCRSAPTASGLCSFDRGDALLRSMYPAIAWYVLRSMDCVSTRLDRTLFDGNRAMISSNACTESEGPALAETSDFKAKPPAGDRSRSAPPARAPRVYELIREDIIEGRLEANERLVVADLAQRHGTSTNPVREALQLLRGEGFVIFPPTAARASGRSIRISSATSTRSAC